MNSATLYRPRRSAFTMLEMVVATVASAVLMVGLGSVMYIAWQVAYAPTAAAQRAKTADIVNQISDELRFATVITQNTSQILEFVVADRNGDGTAEKIRYEWSGVAGDPLYKTVNGAQVPIAQNVQDCAFGFDSATVSGAPVARTYLTRVVVKLQTGSASHSRIDSAIPMMGRPEILSAYWRIDFDVNPSAIDANADGSPDWLASNGATFTAYPGIGQFSPGQLKDGTWYANGNLATNPANNFTATTFIDIRCKNMAATGNADVLSISANRQGTSSVLLVIRMERQLDGSQTAKLVAKSSGGSEQVLKAVDNLTDDYTRFRMAILPVTNQVSLQINDVGDDVLGGPFPCPVPSFTMADQCVEIGDGAKFDYVDVRVGTN